MDGRNDVGKLLYCIFILRRAVCELFDVEEGVSSGRMTYFFADGFALHWLNASTR